MKTKSVSIVIPTYKRQSLAIKLAQSVRRFYPKAEIIIVEQEAEKQPNINILKSLNIVYRNLDKANSAHARNLGFKLAHGEIVIYFDDDVEITSKTIINHLRAYNNPKTIGVAGRVINDYEIIPSDTNVETGRTNFLGIKFSLNFWSTKEQNVDFPYGCNMSFLKNSLEKAGGFDENLPSIFEEIDLGIRISKKIGQIKFISGTMLYHHKAASGGIRQHEINKIKKQKMIYQAFGYYLGKNITFPTSLISLMIRTKTCIFQAPYAIVDLWRSFFQALILKITHSVYLNKEIIIIFCIALLLRFWAIPRFFIFGLDEEYQALLASEQLKNFHPIWIGVSASNTGYYLGPGLVYLIAILLKLSNNIPVIFGYFASLLGILTLISLYFITKELINKKVAIVASFIYTFSPLIVNYDRKYWPLAVPFTALWLYYSLVQAKKNPIWLLLTAILIGGAYHLHLSLWLFWPFIIYTFFAVRHKLKLVIPIGFVIIFIAVTVPLLFYDFIHNFDNLLLPIRLIKGTTNGSSSLQISSHFNQLFSSLGKLWFIPPSGVNMFINLFFSLITLLIILYLSIKQKKYSVRFILVFQFIFIAGFLFFPGPIQEYYFVIFMPFFALTMGIFISKFSNQLIILLLIIYAGLGLFSLTKIFSKPDYQAKISLIKQVKVSVNNKLITLNFLGDYINNGGWRYLFQAYGLTPGQSQADQMFGWIYQNEIQVNNKPAKTVIIGDGVEPPLNDQLINKYRSGNYYGYIYSR